MTGHLWKVRDGVYGLRVELPRLQDGRRRQRRFQVHGTRKQAELRLAKLVQELSMGSDLDGSRTRTSDYMDRWLSSQATHLARSTYIRYEGILRDFIKPTFGNVPLENLTPLRIQESIKSWATAKRRDRKRGPLSPRTVCHVFATLSTALRQAVRWQILARNPCDSVRPPKFERKQIAKLNRANAIALLNGFENHDLDPIVGLALGSGLRRGELLALKWIDIDFSNHTLQVSRSVFREANGDLILKSPKTPASQRLVWLPLFAIMLLEKHLLTLEARSALLGQPISPFVFCDVSGQMLDPDKVSSAFYYTVRQRKLPIVSLHGLRHSFATLSLAAGTPLKVTSGTLGHTKIGTTGNIYTGVLDELYAAAAERFQAFLFPG